MNNKLYERLMVESLVYKFKSWINAEYQSWYIYEAISGKALERGYTEASAFFAKKASEELEHARDVRQHLIDREILIEYRDIIIPEFYIVDYRDMFTLAYNHEIKVSDIVQDIFNIAKNVDQDFEAETFLIDYVKEQTEEVAEIKALLDKLDQSSDILAFEEFLKEQDH